MPPCTRSPRSTTSSSAGRPDEAAAAHPAGGLLSDQRPPGGSRPPRHGQHRGRRGQQGPPPGYAQRLGQQGQNESGQPGQPRHAGEPPYEQLEVGDEPAPVERAGGDRHRRLLLVGGALALATIAVVLLVRLVHDRAGPERVAEDWFEAVADEDCDTMRQLSTADLLEDLQQLCGEGDLLDDDVALEIIDSTVTEEADATATVELTLRLRVAGQPEDDEQEDSIVELVKQDGGWKVSSAT